MIGIIIWFDFCNAAKMFFSFCWQGRIFLHRCSTRNNVSLLYILYYIFIIYLIYYLYYISYTQYNTAENFLIFFDFFLLPGLINFLRIWKLKYFFLLIFTVSISSGYSIKFNKLNFLVQVYKPLLLFFYTGETADKISILFKKKLKCQAINI